MRIDQLLALINKKVEDAGSQRAVALELGITPAYLSDVLSRRREPGESVLAPLGLRKKITYEKVDQ